MKKRSSKQTYFTVKEKSFYKKIIGSVGMIILLLKETMLKNKVAFPQKRAFQPMLKMFSSIIIVRSKWSSIWLFWRIYMRNSVKKTLNRALILTQFTSTNVTNTRDQPLYSPDLTSCDFVLSWGRRLLFELSSRPKNSSTTGKNRCHIYDDFFEGCEIKIYK